MTAIIKGDMLLLSKSVQPIIGIQILDGGNFGFKSANKRSIGGHEWRYIVTVKV